MSEQEVKPKWARVRHVLAEYGVSRTTLREWIKAGHVVARQLGERGDLLVNVASVDRHISGGLSDARIDPASALSESRRQMRLRRKDLARKRRLRR